MKHVNVSGKVVIGMFILLLQLKVSAQGDGGLQPQSIKPYPVAIGYGKTSNLIFPYGIKSVDRGSPDILVQKAKGVDNILQLKAGRRDFSETNLTVVTLDGGFYSFLVDYAPDPSALNLSFERGNTANVLLKDQPLNAAKFQVASATIKGKRHFLHVRTHSQKMELSLQSIYLKDGLMYFDLKLRNKSLISYTPENIRFFLRDRKRAKRTAVQETEIMPLYHDPAGVVTGHASKSIILAFRPFTLSSAQELIIQMGESQGGRGLMFRVSHNILLKARLLPSLSD